MTNSRRSLGKLGEAAAVEFLLQKGYTIRERNWRCRFGELDIVMEFEGVLVIVEVRSKSSDAFGTAEESVNRRKQHKVRSVASYYIQSQHAWNHTIRFDMISVMFAHGVVHKIHHIENAF